MKKRLVAALMVACMVGASLTGCGRAANDVVDTDIEVDVDSTDSNNGGSSAGVAAGNKTSSYDFMSSILSFADGASASNYAYAESQYGLAEDYVFEFEASDVVGNNSYDSFQVYRSEEALQYAIDEFLESGTTSNKGLYVTTKTYEDGKLKIAPHSSMEIDDEGIHDVNGSSWGVYNRLFLVQFVDLETGEALDNPIVTIFSIDHKMDAPMVKQGLNDSKHYQLSWEAVPGATSYGIYEISEEGYFYFQATTSSTSIDVREFASEKELLSILGTEDLSDNGSDFGMNYFVAHAIKQNERYVVIAFNGNENSGISNIVDPDDIGATIPSSVTGTQEYNISSALDVPMYADVEMADGSIKKMLIEYHGALIYDCDDYLYISTVFYNTNLHCGIKLVGITLDELSAHKDDIKSKMEEEAARVGGVEEAEINVSEVPNSSEEENTENVEEHFENTTPGSEEVTPDNGGEEVNPDNGGEEVNPDNGGDVTPDNGGEEVNPDNGGDVTPDNGGAEVDPGNNGTVEYADGPVGYYQQTLDEINAVFTKYGIDTQDVNDVLYADSQLCAYISYALMARMEYIPVPVEIFPEATDTNHLVDVFCVAYRQNPTSGMLNDLRYSYEAQTLLVSYKDDTDLRLRQTKEELETAHNLANTIVNSSMSDYEKMYAINQYFCDNASYDFDSTSTDSNLQNMPQSYIDAHTPYGILCKNYGVCESYSEAIALTSRCAGINVLMEVGVLVGAGGHEWNRVEIGGKYYILDATNNDIDICPNSALLVTDAQATMLAPEKGAFFVNAYASDSTQEYYYTHNAIAYSEDEAVQMLEEMLNNGTFAAVRLAYDVTDDDYANIFRRIMGDGYNLQDGTGVNNVIGMTL